MIDLAAEPRRRPACGSVSGVGLAAAAGLVFLAALPAPCQGATKHPTLVSTESARCSVCHEELTGGRALVHAPVADDCTICHEFSSDETGTAVALVDAEPALCLMCHDELGGAVELELEAPHYPVGDSCLNCHEAHAGDHPSLLRGPTAAVCGECHDVGELAEPHGGQLTTGTDCAACHQPHGSNNQSMLLADRLHPPFADGSCTGCHRAPFGDRIRLRVRGQRLCVACHGEFPETDGGSEHAALQGDGRRAGCLSCHDPHMSARAALLLAAEPALCGTCHSEVVSAATASTGHFAAADSCLNCHLPHTAEQTRLLIEPPDDVCGGCHDLEPDSAGGGLPAAHLGADLGRLRCVSCHSPHGAGHPKLLAEHLHPPVEDGCDVCHEGGHDELMEGGAPDLCLVCHDDVGAAAAEAAVPHAALELGSCTDCHNPHASAQEKLVKGPGAGPCAECHEEQAAGPDEVAHGVIDLIGCRACHEPHGGDNEKMLRLTGPSLCLSCHDAAATPDEPDTGTALLLGRFEVSAAVARSAARLRLSSGGDRDHPVTGHRVLGRPTAEELERTDTVYRDEFECLTCHDPHKGRSRGLFKWNAASTMEACQACHLK